MTTQLSRAFLSRNVWALGVLLVALWLPTTSHASTVALLVSTADTGATPNTSGAFTPTNNDLLVVFVIATSMADAAPPLTSSAGTTFTLVRQVLWTLAANSVNAFVADSLSTATSQTVTFDDAGDAASGTVIIVFGVQDVTGTGSTAVVQSQETFGGAIAPSLTFPANASTDNPTLGVVGEESNPAGITEPTGWTEATDTGYNTPTTGAEAVFRNSGFASTTITWGSAATTTFGAITLELDASGGGGTAVKDPIGIGIIPFAR